MIAAMAGQLLHLLTFALIGFALILIVEGLIYALFPTGVKALLRRMVDVPSATLRSGGLIATVAGIGLISLLRL